ncbi:MAG TPA: hypothetical protein VEL74_23630 [Thermoanaerobaculia bacterium]|nr:hypothetical protein [Thermoanaerobaculia bacterium]
MPNRLVLALILLVLPALPVDADTVYLLNGRTFEGVIAEVTDSQVRIRMQGGVLSLPKTQVLRVEESDSDYGEYLRRKGSLQRSTAAAGDWLELARWAKARGLQQAAREAGLEAAAIEPGLAGLEPLLRGYGYVLDKDLDRWIPYADSMRRKGFVQANGQWITREEYASRQSRQRDEEIARLKAAREAADAARIAREAELAVAELELRTEKLRSASAAPQVPYGTYGMPMYVVPGYFAPPLVVVPGGWSHGGGSHHRPRPSAPSGGGGHRPSTGGGHNRSSYLHQPGSLIPGRLVPMSTN